jgi:hypothetical protein
LIDIPWYPYGLQVHPQTSKVARFILWGPKKAGDHPTFSMEVSHLSHGG